MASLIERLRQVRLATTGCDHALLCEEAAREIERLMEKAETYRQESEYLGGATYKSADWSDDT